jgi:hypothetical protein
MAKKKKERKKRLGEVGVINGPFSTEQLSGENSSD